VTYLPLVWAAFRRHTTESLLTFLVLTVAFTLFGSMVALKAAYENAINVNRMDRMWLTDRFCCMRLAIGVRDQITRMPGVLGVGLLQGLFGYHQDPSRPLGIARMSASRRTGLGSVIVKLAQPQAFDEFQRWLTTNPALSVDAARVSEHLLRTDGRQMKFFTRITYVIGVIMALGALFGAIKIMYAAVRARTREIGTLRALGFGSAPVVLSVLLEATALALAGAALGAFVAWLVFDGREVYSWGVFRLRVSAQLVGLGIAWGVVIALLGGVFPAVRAGRIPATQALRAV